MKVKDELIRVLDIGGSTAIIIPVEVSKELEIVPGIYLRFVVKGTQLILEKVKFEVDRK